MKARIVKRTNVDGTVTFVIQQKHFLFSWRWVDACINNEIGVETFPTLEQAQKHLCYFDGSEIKEEIVKL